MVYLTLVQLLYSWRDAISGWDTRYGWVLGIAIAISAFCANSALAQITSDRTLPNNSIITPADAVEATGWVVNDKGEVTLISEPSKTTSLKSPSVTRQFLPLQLFTAKLKPEHLADAEEAKRLAQKVEQLNKQGKYSEAIPLAQKVLAITEKVLGKEHFYVATSLNNLAVLYLQQGNYQQAESLFQRSLTIIDKVAGKEHFLVTASLNNLAILYLQQGKYQQTEQLFERSLAIIEKVALKEHPYTAVILYGLAALYREQGKEHPDVALNLNRLASLYREQGNDQQAELLLFNNFKQPVLCIWLPTISSLKFF